MGVVVGVDGCRSGWLAATMTETGHQSAGLSVQLQVFPHISALWTAIKPLDPEAILIDIPIGLPDAGMRTCDRLARQMLKRRASTLFAVPTRAALYASAYAEGSQLNLLVTGKMFSRQLWNIAPKIREVDALVRGDPFARARFQETHPELIFTGLMGQPPVHPKKADAGFNERLTVLERYLPGAAALITDALKRYKRNEVARDDVVDALAALVAGRSGTLVGLPNPAEADSFGLPMQIVYPLSPRIVRLHHVQLTIPADQVETARAFYCDLLGLREVPRPDALRARGGFWLELGDIEIQISVDDAGDRQAAGAHLACQVNDLAYWRDTLTARGIDLMQSGPLPGYQRFEFRDPFGNRVEFIQPE